jgi:hypothetical protein
MTKKNIYAIDSGGVQFTAHGKGYLENFFMVYSSEDMLVNILSMAEVEDMYKFTYVHREAFIVHLLQRDIMFKCRGGHYIVDWVDICTACTTSIDTKAEEL